MKGYIRKYLKLDDFNSDGEAKSERSKKSGFLRENKILDFES